MISALVRSRSATTSPPLPSEATLSPSGGELARRARGVVAADEEPRRGAAPQLGERALEEQAAAVDDAEVGGDLLDLGEEMARHENGDALLAGQPAQQRAEVLDACRVEAVGGLVEDEEPRLAEERQRQRQPLAHAERVGAHEAVGVGGQLDEAQQNVDAGGGRGEQAAGDLEVFAAGEVAVERRALDERADAAERTAVARGERLAEDLHRAAARPQQAQQQADRRRLAGAVGTEEAVDGAGRHREVQLVDAVAAREALAQSVGLDGVQGGILASKKRRPPGMITPVDADGEEQTRLAPLFQAT